MLEAFDFGQAGQREPARTRRAAVRARRCASRADSRAAGGGARAHPAPENTRRCWWRRCADGAEPAASQATRAAPQASAQQPRLRQARHGTASRPKRAAAARQCHQPAPVRCALGLKHLRVFQEGVESLRARGDEAGPAVEEIALPDVEAQEGDARVEHQAQAEQARRLRWLVTDQAAGIAVDLVDAYRQLGLAVVAELGVEIAHAAAHFRRGMHRHVVRARRSCAGTGAGASSAASHGCGQRQNNHSRRGSR